MQSKEWISLSRSKYAYDLLPHFHMEDCKQIPSPFQSRVKLSLTCTSPEANATLYHQLVGILFYLTHSYPDISFVIGLVSQDMQHPHESHWKEVKIILRYIRGAIQFGIHYSIGETSIIGWFHRLWICWWTWWSEVYYRLCIYS